MSKAVGKTKHGGGRELAVLKSGLISGPRNAATPERSWLPERAENLFTLLFLLSVGSAIFEGRWFSVAALLVGGLFRELMEPDPDDSDKDEVYRRSCCEKCQHVQQSNGSKKITPEKLSRGRYQARLEAGETYECVLTGLIFEASERVVVRYSVLPWSKFGRFLPNRWMIAGPIFNVKTVPKNDSAIKFTQLPHSLCLAGPVDEEKVFGVLHITGKDPVIEPAEEFSGSHLKWSVSSLCPVAPIVQKAPSMEYHGAVLLYKDLSSDDKILNICVYLAPNSTSHVRDIKEDLLSSGRRYGKVRKNPACTLKVTKYDLKSDQTAVRIDPIAGLAFTPDILTHLGFYDVQYKNPPCMDFQLELQLKERTESTDDNVQAAWSANILEGDLKNCPEVKVEPSTGNTNDLNNCPEVKEETSTGNKSETVEITSVNTDANEMKSKKTRQHPTDQDKRETLNRVQPCPGTLDAVLASMCKMYGDYMKNIEGKEPSHVEYGKNDKTGSLYLERMKQLIDQAKSVCQVRIEGQAAGSGFLLFDKFILTNAHVIVKVFDDRTNQLNQEVTVSFCFEDLVVNSGQSDSVPVKRQVVAYAKLTDYLGGNHDWALLELDLELDSDLTGLMSNFKQSESLSGGICIIGHPEGGAKKLDTCHTIPVTERLKVAFIRYFQNVFAKKDFDPASSDLKHLVNQGPDLAYDTCFLYGSSGSPVFDEFCNVVGMHTGGYAYENQEGQIQSLIEHAQPLSRILPRLIIRLVERQRFDVLEKYLLYTSIHSNDSYEQVKEDVKRIVGRENLREIENILEAHVGGSEKIKEFINFVCPEPMDIDSTVSTVTGLRDVQ